MIIELLEQKFRGTLRLSRQWPTCIITPMATNVPDGYYLGKNGKLYKSRRPSLIERFEANPEQTATELDPRFSPYKSTIFGEGFEEIKAPTKSRGKLPPRAHYCGYHQGAELLVIIFRAPGRTSKGVFTATGVEPWVYYVNIDQDTWESLKSATSTGVWLRENLDGYGWAGVPGNDKTGLAELVEDILQS